MKAIVMTFDGPRSAELIEAEDRAGRDRLGPTILAHPRMRDEFVNMTVLRQPGRARAHRADHPDPSRSRPVHETS